MIATESLRRSLDKTYVQFRGWKFRKNPIQKFAIEIQSSRYRVATISSWTELENVLRLRYEVFIREGLDKKKAFQIDIDKFDFLSDHLCVFEQESGEIVGTYRLLSDQFTKDFYSETEFELEKFFGLEGSKLEMGRACIHPQHRNGMVIALLWKGIYQYMKMASAKYLFGCTSFKLKHVADIEAVKDTLALREAFDPNLNIGVLPKFRYSLPKKIETPKNEVEIPGLVRSYLKAGAKLAPEPAYDRSFRCFDFFTCLDISRLEASFHRYAK